MTTTRKHQRGAALFVGLIFLLVLTILGLTAARVSTLDERMAGNFLRAKTAAASTDERMMNAVRYVDERANDSGLTPPTGAYVMEMNLNQCANLDNASVVGCDGEKWSQALTAGVAPTGLQIPAGTTTLIEKIGATLGVEDLEVGSIQLDDYFRITATSDVIGANNRSVQSVRQMVYVP